MIVAEIIVVLAGVFLSMYVAYWLLLLVAHFLLPETKPRGEYEPRTRFAVIVPAHNEEALLPALLLTAAANF